MEDRDGRTTVALRLRDGAQLFNTLDPFPFREGDLAPEAEEYIVDWARDLPKDEPIAIVIHLERPDAPDRPAPVAAMVCIISAASVMPRPAPP